MNGLGVLQSTCSQKACAEHFPDWISWEIMNTIVQKIQIFWGQFLGLIQRYNVYEETGFSQSIFQCSSISKNTVFGLLTRYLCYQGTKVLLEIANLS
ncbi:hypothetical protein AgCh_010685 [Apium graveolens]